MRARVPGEGYFRALTPCREACPVHTDAHGYVQAVLRGDFDEAYRIARAPNPLASICGRICGAPCETACRRGEIDAPVSIRALKRAAYEHSRFSGSDGLAAALDAVTSQQAERLLDVARQPGVFGRETAHAKHIGIIGSGPAGLSAAHDLALLGHDVNIYEMEAMAAGMMRLGIPAYRLPRDIVDKEVQFIEALGVTIQTNCEVGKDVDFSALLDEHDALIVAVGAKRSRMLPLPGVDGPGVLGGVEFLREINLGRDVTLGNRVVVVGGGNVAFDVARSVIRKLFTDVTRIAAQQAGVHEVRLVCLEGAGEMPADDVEVIEGSEEGIIVTNSWGPTEVTRGSDGRVTGLRARAVERVFDEAGRFAPTFFDTWETFEADTVIFAIGQRFEVGFLEGVEGLSLDDSGAPVVRATTRTTHPKIWVAGDLAHGPKLAIHAVASGKAAAASIHKELNGEDITADVVEVHAPVPQFDRLRDYEVRRRSYLAPVPVEDRVQSHDLIVETGPSQAWARYEASRCLDCSVHTIFDGPKCVLCGGCVDVCPMACFKLVNLAELDLGADARAARSEGMLSVSSALVKDETICIRCGLCAQRCPTDAITMQLCSLAERSGDV